MLNSLVAVATLSIGQIFVVNPQIPIVVQQPQPIVYQYVIRPQQYIYVLPQIQVPVYQPVYAPYPIYRIYP